MITSGMMTSKSDEWATPQNLFDQLDREFDFTLDPCSTDQNAKCRNHYTKEQNGLEKMWGAAGIYESSLRQADLAMGAESL